MRTQPVSDRPPADEHRRALSTLRADDVIRVVAAAAAALAAAWWLVTQVLPIDSPLGFVVIAYLLFLGFFAILVPPGR